MFFSRTDEKRTEGSNEQNGVQAVKREELRICIFGGAVSVTERGSISVDLLSPHTYVNDPPACQASDVCLILCAPRSLHFRIRIAIPIIRKQSAIQTKRLI